MLQNDKKKLDQLFIRLCEDYHPKVVKYLYYTVGDMEQANDLAQEVFITIYKRIDLLEKHENQAGFIYQTAKFIGANYKRKSIRKRLKEQPLDEAINLSCKEDAYDTLASISDKAINEENYIGQVLTSISYDKQILYRMHYIEGKNYREIAETLGINEVSLRMRYVRLRREIKNIIAQIARENFT